MTVLFRDCTVASSRYVVSDQIKGSTTIRHFGVWDQWRERWARLPDEHLCWGMTADEALDALLELRGQVEQPAAEGE